MSENFKFNKEGFLVFIIKICHPAESGSSGQKRSVFENFEFNIGEILVKICSPRNTVLKICKLVRTFNLVFFPHNNCLTAESGNAVQFVTVT